MSDAHLAGAVAILALQLNNKAEPNAEVGELLDWINSSAISLKAHLPGRKGYHFTAAEQARLTYCALAVLKLAYLRKSSGLPRALLLLEALTSCLMPLETLHFQSYAWARVDHWAYWDFEIAKLIIARKGRLSDY